LTARGLLEYYGAVAGMSRAGLRSAIDQRLDEVGLSDRANDSIGGFSKGMLQRLALAQALVNDPDLLVLDEPAEGMDLLARQMLHDVLRRRQQRRKTAIFVSHGLSDIERVCDHVAVLKYGELAFAGRMDELLSQRSPQTDLEDVLEPLYTSAES